MPQLAAGETTTCEPTNNHKTADQSQPSLIPKDLRISFELKVPFSISEGRLAVAIKPDWEGELPIEGFEGLFLVLPEKVVEVEDLNDLRGRVKIETGPEALAFARLRTSPRTYYLFDNRHWEMEIINRDQIDRDFVFGDERWRKSLLTHAHSGVWGITTSKRLKELGIGSATSSRSGEGYEIRRSLLREDLKTGVLRMLKVAEFVGPDGHYLRKQSDEFDLPKGMLWSIPKFK